MALATEADEVRMAVLLPEVELLTPVIAAPVVAVASEAPATVAVEASAIKAAGTR